MEYQVKLTCPMCGENMFVFSPVKQEGKQVFCVECRITKVSAIMYWLKGWESAMGREWVG